MKTICLDSLTAKLGLLRVDVHLIRVCHLYIPLQLVEMFELDGNWDQMAHDLLIDSFRQFVGNGLGDLC